MQDKKVNVSFFLDKSRPNAENRCLIKINVYCRPHKKRYATTFHATEDDWEKLNGTNLRDEKLKGIKLKMNALKLKTEKIIEKIDPFSFVAFEEVFLGNSTSDENKSKKLEDWFTNTINKLKANDQVGTAGSYQTTINSINDFKKNLQIHDITPAFLQSYEKHMVSEKKSLNTVGIYMRNLRAIINEAIDGHVLSKEKYPFLEYQIPTGQNVKKALKDFDINLILNHAPEKLDHQKAIDFWIFSYLCSGINFADIIALKPANIDGNHLNFFRQKTIRTKKKDLRPIKVGLNPRAITIIEKWKNTDPENPYLFPILEAGLSAKTIKNRCQRFIKWVNKRMYEICEDLKIEHKTSTYAARHSFSTVLKRKGIPTSFIKDALGHSSVATTENYLDSFADDVKVEYANLLTNL